MSGGGGGGDSPLLPTANGGEFLLSLLQNPQSHHNPQKQQVQPQPQQQQLPLDPAVAAVGRALPLPLHWPSNGRDLSNQWPQTIPQSFAPNFLGFPQNPYSASSNNQFAANHGDLNDELRRLVFLNNNNNNNHVIHNLLQQKQQQQQRLVFGSLPSDIQIRQNPEGLLNGNSLEKPKHQSSSSPYERGKQTIRPPPGFTSKPRGGEGGGSSRDYGTRRKHVEHNADKFSVDNETGLRQQFDHPGPPAGSNLQSVSATDVEESLSEFHRVGNRDRFTNGDKGGQADEVAEKLLGSLLIEDSDDKKEKKQHRHDKESRMDNRGQWLLSQRVRGMKRQMEYRSDILKLNAPLLAIYESLIPLEEEISKQKQLLALLEKLVRKEWPNAQLFLYGSCANSFGVSKSDVDVCLVFNEDINDKAEILLKLADILQSDNLQNVQALTRARVPIVKLMDPATGISCDICINNVLAVVNTKLLHDYAKIDARLRQLAFLVKHWAKTRGVNETYRGTLSSYAYVLMCIHFLQQRRPAILPCLQGMEKTYNITVGNIECAYFDKVEQLRDFGSSNKETVAQLLWEFFNYWAYGHDYANTVISVRTGSIISKQGKDWTRRIGNDRHLICIEDPFETSHDLGRVVDKFSIRVLREEFERAADIMQYDPNPCVKLFEPYVHS